MGLRLSSADIASLEHANTVLLSPLAYENSESWRLAAGRAVEVCVGGDAVAFALSLEGEPFMAANADVASAMAKITPPPDWLIRGLTVRRHQLGETTIGWDDAFDVRAVKRTSFYNDVARPQGLLAPLMMVSDIGEHGMPTTLSVMFNDENSAQRHAQRRKDMLRLLSPAFCAGVTTLFGFRRNRAALGALAEDAAIGVLFFDTQSLPGRENEFFQRLMEGEPERERVRAEVVHAVRGIFRFPAFDGMPRAQRRAHSGIQTAAARYRIAAHFFEDQSSPGMAKAVALVERVERKPLDARELDIQFSLTRRQIEAAQLLRRGLSTRQIASELGISVNTARRHIERVLLKLDVHTRTAAAAKLSGD